MKSILSVVLIWSLLSCKQKGIFEGEVRYKLTFSPENAKVDSIALKDYYGDQQTYKFKDGNYRWDMNRSKVWVGTIYNRLENKIFYLKKDSEVVAWKSGAKQTDSIISMHTLNYQAAILGYDCNVLEVKSKLLANNSVRTRLFYYSSALRIAPEWFRNNRSGGYDSILSTIKSIPLKIVDDFGSFKITYEATNIFPQPLADSFFKVQAAHFVEVN